MYANEIEQREKMFPTRPPDVPEPEPEEERTVKSILTSFAESTTMHGLAKVGSPHRRGCSKAVWVLLVMTFFGWATYNVTLILMNFSSNPISTLVTVRFEDRQPFPAITICNLNQVLQSQLSGNIKLKSLREKLEEKMPDWDRLLEDGERFRQELEEFAKNLAGVNGTQNFSSFFASYPFPPDVGERIQRLGEGLNLSFPPDVGERIQRLGEGLNLSFPPDILGFPLKPTRPPGAIPPGGTTIPAAPFPGAASTSRNSGVSTPETSSQSTTPPSPSSSSISTKQSSSPPPPSSSSSSSSTSSTTSTSSTASSSTASSSSSSSTSTASTSTTTEKWFGGDNRFEDPDYQSEYSEYHWEGEGVEEPAQAEAIEKSEESRAEIRSFMDRLSPKERFQFGHQMLEMLVECRYHTHTRCSFKNFTRFYNHYFGNCFTFNKDESVDSVSKPGPLYGLTLLLNVQSDQYIQLSDTVGLKVLVHPQDSMPFPEDEGVIISPGFTTNIAIKMQEFRRSPPPYEQCKYYSEEENRMLNMYALPPYRVNYTEEACQRTCYQRTVVQSCGCCDGDYPCIEHSPAIPAHNIGFCQSPMEMLCMKKVHHDLENSELGCADECGAETIYSGEVSMGVWPPDSALKVMKKRFRDHPVLSNFTDIQDFRNNIAKLSIFFKQLNYEKFETFPSYDISGRCTCQIGHRRRASHLSWYRLLSDLGGQLGLWLGVSLLTFVELLELLCQVLAHLGRRAHHTGHSLTRSLTNNGPKTAPPAAPV